MKFIAMLLWLTTLPAQAQWVAFTPCGLKATEEIERGYEAFAGPSENISVAYIWVPSVVALVGFPKAKSDDAVCSLIVIPGREVYVVGSVDEVLGWLENE